MKLTTFLSLLSAVFSIAASCYTIIRFMDNGEDERKNVQEVNEVQNTTENNTDYQELHEDYQDDIHQDIYQYIKRSKVEEESERKKERSRQRVISFLMKSLSLLITYLIVALIIVFFIKNRKEYTQKIAKKDIIPAEIKKFFLKLWYHCQGKSAEVNIDDGTKLSLLEKNVLFELDEKYSQFFFAEIGYVFFGFYIFADLLEESLISLLFALFKDRKKSFFRRWKEVVFSLKESFFDQLPLVRIVSQIAIHFINILGLYFMFRIVVYGVDKYNNAPALSGENSGH